MAVAQLYARDVPELTGPKDMDLLQVLWCPFDEHENSEVHAPAVYLRWRRARDVSEVLADRPEPPILEYGDYLPAPCVLHPEEVIEYQYGGLPQMT